MGAGLRSRSWQANAARMQLAQNMERDGIDFERNRRFTLRSGLVCPVADRCMLTAAAQRSSGCKLPTKTILAAGSACLWSICFLYNPKGVDT